MKKHQVRQYVLLEWSDAPIDVCDYILKFIICDDDTLVEISGWTEDEIIRFTLPHHANAAFVRGNGMVVLRDRIDHSIMHDNVTYYSREILTDGVLVVKAVVRGRPAHIWANGNTLMCGDVPLLRSRYPGPYVQHHGIWHNYNALITVAFDQRPYSTWEKIKRRCGIGHVVAIIGE